MTFSKNVTVLLKDIHKLKSKSDPEKRIPIAEEMFGRSRSLLNSAEELGAHAARFAGIAWNLDIVFLSLLILTFYVLLSICLFHNVVIPFNQPSWREL